MKVWITKYALSSGIFTAEVKDTGSTVVNVKGYYTGFYGKDWHRTEKEAIARAEEMRAKRLQSLERQVKKISVLKFDIKDMPSETN